MKITVVCSDPMHPKWPGLVNWVAEQPDGSAELLTAVADAKGGDFLFLVSVQEMVGADVRTRYRHTLVIHASDLPHGRGWSPHVWTVLEGGNRICITMLEASNKVDSGAIWMQQEITLEGHELCDEIASLIGAAELDLMRFAIVNEVEIRPRPQDDREATYYPRRFPSDSALDVNGSFADQFELLRVSDHDRYPAYIDHRGHRYAVKLTKIAKLSG